MRILLIDPPHERLIGFKSEWFPLGLAYIASFLLARGEEEVAIYHAEHASDTEYRSILKHSQDSRKYKSAVESDEHPVWREIRENISVFRPDVVGISVLTPKVPSAQKIARIAKSINPGVRVVFGGHHPTINPDEMLLNKNVDFVIRGEGEETFCELIACLKNRIANYQTIPGLSFSDNGKIIHNCEREYIENLDLLPMPARDRLLNLATYTPVQLSMIMASRGCPYQCGFCASQNMWNRRVRFRSVENILKEIEELRVKYSVRNINFMDDSFTLDKNRVEEFCREVLKKRVDITWSCLTRVDMITDEIIPLMKRAGCTKVDIGIESGNQRVLDLIGKKITRERVKDAVTILRRNRMYWSGFFMFGFPTETEEEIFDTLNFLKELKPDWANISIFTPYPGTPLYELAREKGMVNEPPDYTLYSHQNPYLRHTDKIPRERFCSLARQLLGEVHRYNSSYRSLMKRALTRKYHRNPHLLFQDARKVVTWLKK